jgi:hypothetical protein
MKFGTKMKSAHSPYALNSLRAPGREAARNRKRPAARSPSDHAPHARPPCSPRRKSAQRPTRARRVPRSRPQPRPRPGKFCPAWAESRSGECESFISIQRLREVFSRTKPRSGSVAQTLASFHIFLRSLSRAAAATPRDRRAAPERARPRCRPSPSPVCALTVG